MSHLLHTERKKMRQKTKVIQITHSDNEKGKPTNSVVHVYVCVCMAPANALVRCITLGGGDGNKASLKLWEATRPTKEWISEPHDQTRQAKAYFLSLSNWSLNGNG